MGLSWLLTGCYSTDTLADGTVCKRYEPSCWGATRLVCEVDENGCETCTCVSTGFDERDRADHESGRNPYWEPER
jgi:hypothetical protein